MRLNQCEGCRSHLVTTILLFSPGLLCFFLEAGEWLTGICVPLQSPLVLSPCSLVWHFWRKLPGLQRRPGFISQTWNFSSLPEASSQACAFIFNCMVSPVICCSKNKNTASKADTFFGAPFPKSCRLESKQCLAGWLTTAHSQAAQKSL